LIKIRGELESTDLPKLDIALKMVFSLH